MLLVPFLLSQFVTLASAQSVFERVLVPTVESGIVLGADSESRNWPSNPGALYAAGRDTSEVSAYYFFRFDGHFPLEIGTAILRDVRLDLEYQQGGVCAGYWDFELELDYHVAMVDPVFDISRFTANAVPPAGVPLTLIRRSEGASGHLVFDVDASVMNATGFVQFVAYVEPERTVYPHCSLFQGAYAYSAVASSPWLIATYYSEPAVREPSPMSWGSVKALYGDH